MRIITCICVFILFVWNNVKADHRGSLGAISNLQVLVEPLESRRCLIVVTSFKTVDILDLTSPLILRQLKPIKSVSGWMRFSGKSNTNASIYQHCNHKFIYYDNIARTLMCSELSVLPFASAIKPWECLLEVSLFFRLRDFSGPRSETTALWYPGAVEYRVRAPLVGTTYILVEDEAYLPELSGERVCERVLYPSRDVMFKFHGQLIGSFIMAHLTKPTEKTSNMSLSMFSWYDNNCKPGKWTPLAEFPRIFPLLLASHKMEERNKNWFTNKRSKVLKHKYNYNSILMECLSVNSISVRHSDIPPNFQRRISFAQAYILRTILRNTTYTNGRNSVCENQNGFWSTRTIKNLQFPAMFNKFVSESYLSFSFPFRSLFYFNDTSKSIRFISSSKRGTSPLPFEELVNVFQPAVWIVSATILFIGGIAITQLYERKISGGPGRELLALAMCVLEQGNAFPSKVCESKRGRGIVAGIFGASILLSNAYKNTNVYNMVVPRMDLLFESFDQLEKENVSVYTRLHHLYHRFGMFRTGGLSVYKRTEGHVLANIELFPPTRTYDLDMTGRQTLMFT